MKLETAAFALSILILRFRSCSLRSIIVLVEEMDLC